MIVSVGCCQNFCIRTSLSAYAHLCHHSLTRTNRKDCKLQEIYIRFSIHSPLHSCFRKNPVTNALFIFEMLIHSSGFSLFSNMRNTYLFSYIFFHLTQIVCFLTPTNHHSHASISHVHQLNLTSPSCQILQ